MPPFGFGLSMPNLQRASAAAPAPVTLVQENWVGSGLVAGRTPSPTNSGGGTWQVNTLSYPVNYNNGSAFSNTGGNVGTGTFRHSVALTDATISSTVQIGLYGVQYAAVDVYARSTPGPTGDITDGYFCRLTNSVNLFKIVSGVSTEIAFSSAQNPTGQTTSFTISGSTLTVTIGGVQVIQITDTSVLTAGYWGYRVAFELSGEETFDSSVGPVTIQTA